MLFFRGAFRFCRRCCGAATFDRVQAILPVCVGLFRWRGVDGGHVEGILLRGVAVGVAVRDDFHRLREDGLLVGEGAGWVLGEGKGE